MNAIVEFALGAAYGLLKEYAGHGGGDVDRLCGDSGWPISERQGNITTLRFNDPALGTRPLCLVPGDDGAHTAFTVSQLLCQQVPPAVADYLTARNARLGFGWWAADRQPDGIVFAVHARLDLRGLPAEDFRRRCWAVVEEAQDFDAKLRAAGFLR